MVNASLAADTITSSRLDSEVTVRGTSSTRWVRGSKRCARSDPSCAKSRYPGGAKIARGADFNTTWRSGESTDPTQTTPASGRRRTDEYRKWRPSGRNCGHRCAISPASSDVTARGMPPLADTLYNSVRRDGAYTMAPSRLHVAPPRPPPRVGNDATSVRTAGSPDTLTVFRSLSPKNPTNWLSGDQKGALAPRVPASGFASTVSSERSMSILWPDESPPT